MLYGPITTQTSQYDDIFAGSKGKHLSYTLTNTVVNSGNWAGRKINIPITHFTICFWGKANELHDVIRSAFISMVTQGMLNANAQEVTFHGNTFDE